MVLSPTGQPDVGPAIEVRSTAEALDSRGTARQGVPHATDSAKTAAAAAAAVSTGRTAQVQKWVMSVLALPRQAKQPAWILAHDDPNPGRPCATRSSSSRRTERMRIRCSLGQFRAEGGLPMAFTTSKRPARRGHNRRPGRTGSEDLQVRGQFQAQPPRFDTETGNSAVQNAETVSPSVFAGERRFLRRADRI